MTRSTVWLKYLKAAGDVAIAYWRGIGGYLTSADALARLRFSRYIRDFLLESATMRRFGEYRSRVFISKKALNVKNAGSN